ncbi:hypothetical protein SO802_011498 [Lithocarpus litseifolius]|uniref:Uncharacterized protein n=1 Tax=Lithocarpus litseifolius TaxID=425828 RepID=A0AAW2D064_9ROSI
MAYTIEPALDITGVTGVKMMPFGVGRRIYPGLIEHGHCACSSYASSKNGARI